ncbi:antibiotic biosynthesis monooxygenase family protein [Staphylococcus warneri]|uniref:antibiotic biosynthesis monooxygenase family protein n=1 Tax=Staphylococcus warneri TaxID=1292 RepID=UPI0021A34C3D|nr:antibiotic biosynthesis monooxygenase [Staphylococcus warneri]MCT2595851.1 antibiotic biosynthesis monooxygenase [Staphylococcus warneri]
MLLNDYYKTYKMNESDDTFMIEKNNDAQYYDILESINELSNDTFCVLNHLYVNEDKETQFEDKFLGRQKHLQDVPGFKALRFLRPQTKHKHYIIVTLWQSRQAFYDWQKSSAYAQIHRKRGTKRGVDNLIVNRDLSYNIRIELEDMANQFLNYEDIF